MKWTHWPVEKDSCEMYQLDDDGMTPIRGVSAELYVINFKNNAWGQSPPRSLLDGWKVQSWTRNMHGVRCESKDLGTIPYDTPEEELKALAIVMWRMT